jgi:hypothetical protein
LYEWIRDDVLGRNYALVKEYFSIHTCISGSLQKNTGRVSRRSVLEKWKCIPKKLAKDHRITAAPDYGLPYWQHFSRLVDDRNGLAHARASRPDTDGLAEKEQPKPKPADLDTMPPGWAVEAVLALIREVHQAAGTTRPPWLD